MPMADEPQSGYYRWTICALLFFATTVNYIDRQVLGILADTIKDEIGRFAPANLVLNGVRENAEHLPVNVVDGRGKEEQRADRPAVVAGLGFVGHRHSLGGEAEEDQRD